MCDGSGWLVTRTPHGTMGLTECEICGVVEQRRITIRKQRAAETLKAFAQSAGRLRHCTLANFDIQRRLYAMRDLPESHTQYDMLVTAFETAQRYVAAPSGWLYLYGPVGAGKSHLAAAICNALAADGYTVAYGSVPDLTSFVRRGFADQTADDRHDTLLLADVLLLDDLGTQKSSEWTEETLFRLIDGRSRREAWTLITSNMDLDQQPYRLASRIAEMAVEVWMPISDYRRIPA